MTLQRREKILAAVAGGLMLLLGFWFLFFSGGSLSYGQLCARRDQLTLELAKKESSVKAAAAAAQRLAEWQRRALPSDVAEARMKYQGWLRELADRLKFQQATIESTGVEVKPKSYTLLRYKIHGRTQLGPLTEFLHAFYSAGHLHQIRLIDVTPVPNGPELDVNIKLSDYSQAIAARNLLGPARPEGPDAASLTFVTAILVVDGRGEAWLVNRMTGQDWKLHEGDQFEVAAIRGTVKSVGHHDIVIEVDGRSRRFHSGENMRGGEEMKTP
jgi:hypothetical protein